MARKPQKAPNYTAGGLELYGQACFALRQSARILVETQDRFKGEPIPPAIMDLLFGQARRALEMFEEDE